MPIRRVNKDLITSIEIDVKIAKHNKSLSCCVNDITKDDFLSISEWLFKTFQSIQVNYNSSTNCSLLIGL
jgi:hypothetical protein